jgi:type IV pilus assembly protein PilN
MRITLNLATRPYADFGPAVKLLRIAMAILVVICLGLGLGLRAVHHKAEEARATELIVQNKIDSINRERLGYQEMMREPANAQLLARVEALNRLFDEKTFSWTLAMEDLETVLPGGVQVTTLEPVRDTKTGHITVKMRVVGPRDRGDDLVQNLEHSKHFLLPHIVGESYESTGGAAEKLEPISASNRFTFELQADYNSDAPMDREGHKTRKQEGGGDTPDSGASAGLGGTNAAGLRHAPAAAVLHPLRPVARSAQPSPQSNRNSNRKPGAPR